MKHPTNEELSAYLERDLPKDRYDGVEKHLETCAECRESLLEMRELLNALQNLPDVQAPPSLVGRVMRRIERRESFLARLWRAGTLSWLPMPGRLIGAVSAVVLVVLLFASLPPSERYPGQNLAIDLNGTSHNIGKPSAPEAERIKERIAVTEKLGMAVDEKDTLVDRDRASSLGRTDLAASAYSAKAAESSSNRAVTSAVDKTGELSLSSSPSAKEEAKTVAGGGFITDGPVITSSSMVVTANGNLDSAEVGGMLSGRIEVADATKEIRLVMRSEDPDRLAGRVRELAIQNSWRPIEPSSEPSMGSASGTGGATAELSDGSTTLAFTAYNAPKSEFAYRSGVPESIQFMVPVNQRPIVVSLLREVGPVESPTEDSVKKLDTTTSGYETKSSETPGGHRVAGLVESGQKGVGLRTLGGDRVVAEGLSEKRQEIKTAPGIAGGTRETENVLSLSFFGLSKDFDPSKWILLTVLLPKEKESR